MKVHLHNLNLLATWTWNLSSDDPDRDSLCGICRVQFDGTCPTCKFPGDDCPILIGKCQHAFHMHCLLMWVQQESSRGLCPMCRQRFEWVRERNLAAVRGGMPGGWVEAGAVEAVDGQGGAGGGGPVAEGGGRARGRQGGNGGEGTAAAQRG